MSISIKKIIIKKDRSISEALKKLSNTGLKCLIVIDGNNKHLGTITDGDIRKKIYLNIKTSQEKFQRFIIKIVYFLKIPTSQKIAEKFMKEKNYP